MLHLTGFLVVVDHSQGAVAWLPIFGRRLSRSRAFYPYNKGALLLVGFFAEFKLGMCVSWLLIYGCLPWKTNGISFVDPLIRQKRSLPELVASANTWSADGTKTSFSSPCPWRDSGEPASDRGCDETRLVAEVAETVPSIFPSPP
jgi:hypothetical protein